MQILTCETCGTTWEREPKRGRKPKQCDDCKAGIAKAPEPAPKPKATKPKTKRKRKSKWAKLAEEQGVAEVSLSDKPLSERKSGWCTDYDPVPAAQHEKCDGDLGKRRCRCECHDWDDLN